MNLSPSHPLCNKSSQMLKARDSGIHQLDLGIVLNPSGGRDGERERETDILANYYLEYHFLIVIR